MARRRRGLNLRVLARARDGATAASIAAALDCGEAYIRATCRRAGVTLRGKRAARQELPAAAGSRDSATAEGAAGPGPAARSLPVATAPAGDESAGAFLRDAR